ncbi:hypothetical protein L6164_009298 [Bauhinia variegata]|uniref:Uncharacterized protein n=1 Tax=Bauhinia variegata TaxID=167791 RepID=A0ACB9PPV2_BAUVA|nr:hypothetical protein L6164_009298 [Bauhinia variegata]
MTANGCILAVIVRKCENSDLSLDWIGLLSIKAIVLLNCPLLDQTQPREKHNLLSVATSRKGLDSTNPVEIIRITRPDLVLGEWTSGFMHYSKGNSKIRNWTLFYSSSLVSRAQGKVTPLMPGISFYDQRYNMSCHHL